MPSTNVLSFAKATNKTRQSVYIKRINDVVMFSRLNENEKLKVLSSPSSFLLLSLILTLYTYDFLKATFKCPQINKIYFLIFELICTIPFDMLYSTFLVTISNFNFI